MMIRLLGSLILVFMMTTGVFAEQVIVFGNEHRPPKIWGRGEPTQGILVDILKSTESEIGVSFSIRGYPWARAYMYATHGKGAIVGISKNFGTP